MLPYQTLALACPATTHPPLRLASLRLRCAYPYSLSSLLPTHPYGVATRSPSATDPTHSLQPHHSPAQPPSTPAAAPDHRTPHTRMLPHPRVAAVRRLPGYLGLSSPPGACLAMPTPSRRCRRWTCTEASPARQPPVRGRQTLGPPPRARVWPEDAQAPRPRQQRRAKARVGWAMLGGQKSICHVALINSATSAYLS